MKRTTAIVCLSSRLITAGCSDSKSGGGKSGNDEQKASGAVIKQFADAWVQAWAPNGKPDAAGALTDNPTVFAKRLDDVLRHLFLGLRISEGRNRDELRDALLH